MPQRAVENEDEGCDEDEADDAGINAHLDGVGTEVGADGALFDDGKLGRQRAGAQQGRKRCGALGREVAGNLAGSAGDRFADDRRAQHLVVEHDGEGLADVLAGDLGKAIGAGAVEAEGDEWLMRVRIEADAGVGKTVARQFDAILDSDSCCPSRPS